MAKVVKSERKIADVEEEIKKVTSSKEKSKKADKKKAKKTEKTATKKTGRENGKKEKGVILKFFREVKKEMSKVKWPNKKEMVKYSLATIVFMVFFGIFFYCIEIIMALLKAWV